MTGLEIEFLGRMAYEKALALQEAAVTDRSSGITGDRVFLLEHEPVYTIGRRRDRSSLGLAPLPHPVVEINRGGQATYHGPGQLVGYFIFDLQRLHPDLHAFLRWIEESLVALLGRFGVEGRRREGLTGVWVGDRKIASIGVGVRRWVTMHGFGLNVGPDLSGFSAITPCGIQGVTMTSLSRETGRDIPLGEAAAAASGILHTHYPRLRAASGESRGNPPAPMANSTA